MSVLPHLNKSTQATTLNSRMSATALITPDFAPLNTTEALIQKRLLQSNPKVVSNLLNKFANDRARFEIDFAIMRCSQLAHKTPMRYGGDPYSKACKIADVYDKSTLYKFFIEAFAPCICHSFLKYWVSHPHADVIDTAFMVKSLLAIQKGATKPNKTGSLAAFGKQHGKCTKLTSVKLAAHFTEIGSSSSPTRSLKCLFRSLSELAINTLAAPLTRLDRSPVSLTLSSLPVSACELCYNLSHSTLSCSVL